MVNKRQDQNNHSEQEEVDNQTISSSGTSGAGGNGRLSQFKNHSTQEGDTPNEFLSSEE
ncbi:hypothetical protein [Paenibacillus segetis]|uniref:DUF4025 domain-containing protein n=1 Tax=Paenibacillus segetis TaxID=1325360 RepID=A0ABQ1YPI0_9BACL|nr:hypothetical protein [Paenibacillus segetis]GGH32262.1 hypothetical protein GCM10008013_36560 [Paenibacillus segetis]